MLANSKEGISGLISLTVDGAFRGEERGGADTVERNPRIATKSILNPGPATAGGDVIFRGLCADYRFGPHRRRHGASARRGPLQNPL
jgi:hypothetical protein